MSIKPGTLITCPVCDAAQLRATKEVAPGNQLKDADWETLGFNMEYQDMICYKCGEPWARQHPKTGHNQIHTDEDKWIATDSKEMLNS